MGIPTGTEVILFRAIAQKMAGSDRHSLLCSICVFGTDTGKAYVYHCIWIDSGIDFFRGRHRLEKENRKNTVLVIFYHLKRNEYDNEK